MSKQAQGVSGGGGHQHGDQDKQVDLDWRDSEGRGAEDVARISGSTRVVALIRWLTITNDDVDHDGGDD